jgi:hypothetical protein
MRFLCWNNERGHMWQDFIMMSFEDGYLMNLSMNYPHDLSATERFNPYAHGLY